MKQKIAISLLNAVVLITLHLFYYSANWALPLEDEWLTWIDKAGAQVLNRGREAGLLHKRRFQDSPFLFVNTGYDHALIRVETETGDSGNLAITDRQLLATFFRQLADNGNRHRYLFCDLLFDKPSPHDAALRTQIKRVSKMLLPAHYDEEVGTVVRPLFDQKWALADYVTFDGAVSKIPLYSAAHRTKTLPLRLYEATHCTGSRRLGPGLWEQNRYVPYAVYPYYFFNREDIRPHELTLSQVVRLLQENDTLFYNNVVRGKFIVLGDFSTLADHHPTPVGILPGSLILFNTYLTLAAGYHLHGWLWLLFLLVSFGLLSYYTLYYRDDDPVKGNRGNSLLTLLRLWGCAVLISVLAYWLFHLHTTVLPVVLYFQALLLVKSFFQKNQSV